MGGIYVFVFSSPPINVVAGGERDGEAFYKLQFLDEAAFYTLHKGIYKEITWAKASCCLLPPPFQRGGGSNTGSLLLHLLLGFIVECNEKTFFFPVTTHAGEGRQLWRIVPCLLTGVRAVAVLS